MPKPETIAWLQQSAALDGSATSRTLLEVLERLERLEAAGPLPEPIDDQQTLHTIALQMVDTLGRSFNLLPEILDTLRRAIREPSPCLHIRSSDEGSSYCALAEQQPAPAAPASAPAGLSLELEGGNPSLAEAALALINHDPANQPFLSDKGIDIIRRALKRLQQLEDQVVPLPRLPYDSCCDVHAAAIRAEILAIAAELEGSDA